MGVKKRITGILSKFRRAVPWLKPYHLVTMVILAILLAHGLMIYSYMNQTERNEQLESDLAASERDLVRKENSIMSEERLSIFRKPANSWPTYAGWFPTTWITPSSPPGSWAWPKKTMWLFPILVIGHPALSRLASANT